MHFFSITWLVQFASNMQNRCSFCEDVIGVEEDALVISNSRVKNGENQFVCSDCEALLKNSFVRCDCSYDCVTGECFDGNCRNYGEKKNHSEECGYTKCIGCKYAPCGCDYSKKSQTCRGNRCYKDNHNDACEYRHCKACAHRMPQEY